MSEFVTWGVLHFHRQIDRVMENQRNGVWLRYDQQAPSTCSVGVMGLGEIGSRVAGDLHRLGFAVRGWARRAKDLAGHRDVRGRAGTQPFLRGTDILVCLLPLTDETRAILGARTLAMLPRGAKLIHVGRGEHLVPCDLLSALKGNV